MTRPLAVALAACLLAPAAVADEGEVPLLEYREEVFHGLGAHMGATAMIVKGEVDRPAADVAGHAKAMAAIGSFLTTMFPKGSGPEMGETRALPAIWTDAAGFEKAATTFTEAATKLAAVAETGDMDAIKAQFGAVGKSCGGCHKQFRAEKD